MGEDDSFNNPPVMKKKVGQHLVQNFERRRSKDAQLGSRAVKYSNRNFTATSLNNKIFFIAVGEKARTKHDVEEYGITPCGLYPYCSNLFRGGEDIAKVYIISPDFHVKYEKETWACFYHAEASMNGQEIQIQGRSDDCNPETPKHSKLSKEATEAATEAPNGKKKPNTKTAKKESEATSKPKQAKKLTELDESSNIENTEATDEDSSEKEK